MGRVAPGEPSPPKSCVVSLLLLPFRVIGWAVGLVFRLFRWFFVDIHHLPQRVCLLFARIRDWLRNASLRKALVFYIIIGLLAALAAAVFTIPFISYLINHVFDSYDQTPSLGLLSSALSFLLPGPDIPQLLGFIGTILPVLYVAGGIVGAGAAFYHFKLKTPLGILNESAGKIAENDLDFQVDYPPRDEMGALVDAFEKMRRSLEQNNRELWRMMEEHKRLNAAFAHDLRTPLTVLRGYSDFLTAYVPAGKISEKKLLETLNTMSQHIARLESYAQTMNAVQKLEDIAPVPAVCQGEVFFPRLANSLAMLCANSNAAVTLEDQTGLSSFIADAKIIEEVVENLVSNALCYAKKQICVTFTAGEGHLRAVVLDDGKGFTPEDLQKAKKAFYKDSAHANSSHFGLGLNICDILCRKHNGSLLLENGPAGGAMVSAVFALFPAAAPPEEPAGGGSSGKI